MTLTDRFADLPIKRKLTLIGVATNSVAVVLLGIVIGLAQWIEHRDLAVANLSVHASVIADSVAPALVFADEKAAGEALERLGIAPTIVHAELRAKTGEIVAQFHAAHRPGPRPQPPHLPILPVADGHLFHADQLMVAKQVAYQGEPIGILYLQADLQNVYWTVGRMLILLVIAMTAALAFAIFLFARFQKTVSQPILALADAMTHVTRENDYSTQAHVPVRGRDEFGALARGFNAMLDAIREQERQVHAEIAKNRDKDHLMIRQSRLAAMGEMIGNIAHQWRQPLNALGLLLDDMRDAWIHQELTRDYLDASVATGRRLIDKMSSTIDDFRNFFRPDREPLPFSLEKAAQEALSVVEASFQNGDIETRLTTVRDAVVTGFPNEYAHVILNILGNARDAIRLRRERGEATSGRVEIVIDRNEDFAVVVIRDNGGGIPGAILDRIFDPYFTTREKGTGIGLYMSKMIIENNMNGRIEAGNAGEGAEFMITLPLAGRTAPCAT